MTVRIRITGQEQAIRNLRRNIDRFSKARLRNASASAIHASANVIMTEAKKRVPRDTDALHNSGYVTAPRDVGGRQVNEIGFGGKAEAYALVQHEDCTLNHPNGGQCKYLESASDTTRSAQRQAAAKAARRALRTGRRSIPRVHPRNPNEGR